MPLDWCKLNKNNIGLIINITSEIQIMKMILNIIT